MAQKLVVPITFKIYQGDALARTETIAQNVIKIGRDQKSHLRIEDDQVSRMHAVIEAKPGEVQIIDLGSGTSVNGQVVNKCALNSNDEIKLGNTRIVVEIGQPVDAEADKPRASMPPPASASAAAPTPSVPPGAAPMPSVPPPAAGGAAVAPPFAAPVAAPFAAALGMAETPAPNAGHGHGSVDGEEIYQLIKRGDINPHEVEEVGSQAVEVSILWKNSILHVAHLDGSKDFVLASDRPKGAPAGAALGGGLGVGAAAIGAGIAASSYALGAVGTIIALGGAFASIAMDHKNIQVGQDVATFIVGPEMLQDRTSLPVILNNGSRTRFVFLPGSTGEAEVDGVKRSYNDLVGANMLQPSSVAPGANEIEVRPNGRYKMEIGGLTVMCKVVARGRKIAAATKRDPAMLGAGLGSAVAVTAAIAAMHLATADDSGFLSQGNEEDRLNELRAFIQRQQERQPEQEQQPQNNSNQTEGGTGTRHAGEEGKMGRRDAPARNARYAIRNNGEPPHLAREAAAQAVANRGIFAALPGVGGSTAATSGIVSPWGAATESGLDDRNANGNMTGAEIGDAMGFGGLGATGTGWGGGGTGEGTIGMGNIGTMGHGSGTGSGDGYGSGVGRGLRDRGNSGPLVRPAAPSVSGLLSAEAIRRVVLRNLGQVAHCHEQGLAQNPQLAGRVAVRFVIGATGTVVGSTVASSNVAVPTVATCIANAVRRWQFPSPEGGGVVTVTYPFNLQAPE